MILWIANWALYLNLFWFIALTVLFLLARMGPLALYYLGASILTVGVIWQQFK